MTLKKTIVLLVILVCGLGLNAQTPPTNLSGIALRNWFKTNYYDNKHETLGYSLARTKMYNFIDNHDNQITCVYSGYTKSWTYGGNSTAVSPINCEHTIPQSFFGQSEPMRSDIHHLYPTYTQWNSYRSNYKFYEIDDNSTEKWMRGTTLTASIPSSNIDEYSEATGSKFEPREDHKGNVARSVFYFFTMYPTQAGDISRVADIDLLYQWHLADPVDADEIARNNGVEQYQGNRNPYIDYPDFVDEAWDIEGATPTVPNTPGEIIIQQSTSALTLSWTDVNGEQGYYVYRSSDASTFTQIETLNANVVSFIDTNVEEDVTYSYYLVAYNAEGNSPNSATVSGMLSEDNGNGGNEPGGSENGTVIISEYLEGSSYNKAIELTNLSTEEVNLSEYSLKRQGGGDTWEGNWVLSGTLSSGSVVVLCNEKAAEDILSIANFTHANEAPMTFNGDDPVGLYHNGTLIDIVGEENSGEQFGKDVRLVRKSSVSKASSVFMEDEWEELSADDFSGLGKHSFINSVADLYQPTSSNLEAILIPNPAKHFCNIHLQTKTHIPLTVSVMSLGGKKVYEERFEAGVSSFQINTHPFSSGVYIVKLETGKHSLAQKLIKR